MVTKTTSYWPVLDNDTDTIELELEVLTDVLVHVLPYVDETYTVLLDAVTTLEPVLDTDTVEYASAAIDTEEDEDVKVAP